MAEEFKTLLKIEGDAGGAKKAVAETKAATEQLAESASAAAQKTTEATNKTAEALDDKTNKTEKAKTGFDRLAESMGLSTRDAEQFRQVLGRISPELSGLMGIAMKGEGAFKTLFTGIGAAAIAAAASIKMITSALNEASAAAARTRAEIERVQAASDEARRAGQERTEAAADVLARAGIVSDAATGKARAIEERFTRQGYKTQAVREVLPLAVSKAGEQILTDEQIANLAAMEEFQPGKLAIKDPRELERVRRKSLLDASRRSALVADWKQAIANRQARQAAGIAQMDTDAIVRRLAATETIPAAQLTQAAADVKQIVQTGRVTSEDLSTLWSGSDRLVWETRQREAARRAASLGLLSPQTAAAYSEITGEQETHASILERFNVAPRKATRLVAPTPQSASGLVAPTSQPDGGLTVPTSQPAGASGGVTYHFHHGVEIVGRDNRDIQIPRVKQ